MKILTLNQINEIQDFQFLTDSSGYVLDNNGVLYKFTGESTEFLIKPNEFKVSKIHFIDEMHGAIIGNGGIIIKEIQKGSLGETSLLLGLFLVAFFFIRKILKAKKSLTYYISSAILVLTISVLAFFSCSNKWQLYRMPDTKSEYSTFILSNQLKISYFHHYKQNNGQTSFISITENGGKDWKTYKRNRMLSQRFFNICIRE